MDDAATIVRRYAEAWLAGDLATLVDCYHEEIELHWFGRNPLAGRHAGRAAALQALSALTMRTRRTLVAVEAVMGAEDQALLIARERWERDGRSIELRRLLLFRVADGRLRECRVYDEDQALVDGMLSKN
jgi:hypothetical protein